MSAALDLDRLVGYSDHERTKWKAWVAADPSRLALPFQPNGRFPTIGSLFDHLFLVERRHLSRMEGAAPPDGTGIAQGDWKALFEYGDLVRNDLRRYVQELDAVEGEEIISWTVLSGGAFPAGTYTISRRRLTAHILLHEVRHLAQIAFAARLAGQEPPGQHDYFYFPEG